MSGNFAVNESFTGLNLVLSNQGSVQQITMNLTTIALLQTERLPVSSIFPYRASINPTVNFQCLENIDTGAQSGVNMGTSPNTGAPWPLIADMLNQMHNFQPGQTVSLRFFLTLAGKKSDVIAGILIPPAPAGSFAFGHTLGIPAYIDPSTNGPVFNTLNIHNMITTPPGANAQQQPGHTTQVTFTIVGVGEAPSWTGSWMTVDAVEITWLG